MRAVADSDCAAAEKEMASPLLGMGRAVGVFMLSAIGVVECGLGGRGLLLMVWHAVALNIRREGGN